MQVSAYLVAFCLAHIEEIAKLTSNQRTRVNHNSQWETKYAVGISAPDRWPEHKHNLCGKEEDGKDREREKGWKGFPVRECQGFPQSHLGHVCWSGLGTFLHRDFTLPLCITHTHTSSLLLSLFKFILLYFSTLFFNYLSLPLFYSTTTQ